MKQEIKTKWIKALRSGKYKQTTGTLKDEVGFCCLGVLCDIYRKEHKDLNLKWDYDTLGNFNCEKSELPYTVRKWAGLSKSDPNVKINNETTTLIHLNDDAGLNFKEIAQVIQDNL